MRRVTRLEWFDLVAASAVAVCGLDAWIAMTHRGGFAAWWCDVSSLPAVLIMGATSLARIVKRYHEWAERPTTARRR